VVPALELFPVGAQGVGLGHRADGGPVVSMVDNREHVGLAAFERAALRLVRTFTQML
jgi:hypothetical protein